MCDDHRGMLVLRMLARVILNRLSAHVADCGMLPDMVSVQDAAQWT